MKPFTASVFGLLLASGSGLTQARPQYGGASSESGLVANIIKQLTPFVQTTVEDALKSRSTSVTTSVSTGSSFGSSGSSFGSSGSSFGSSGSSFGVSGGSGGAGASVGGGASGDLEGRDMFDENPKYTYAYQVASDEKQTYISQTENRDNDQVNGEYSYVDANGSLVTVKYTANDQDGYSETRDVQEGFVQMKYTGAGAGAAQTKEVTAVAPRPAPRPVAVRPAVQSSNSDLVARIISQLTPYIKTTVTETLSANSQPAVTSVSYEAVPAVAVSGSSYGSSSASSSIEGRFGVEGENTINVETPVYQFDAILN